jgi:rhodanese-related sulfurtransferase
MRTPLQPPTSANRKILDLLCGCVWIGLLSLLLGLGLNALRASPIPLIPPFLHATYHEITPEECRALAQEGKLLYLDSRSNGQYKEAHISRALNLPVKDFAALHALLPLEGRWIVIYGQGWGRPTEKELAFLFNRAGGGRIRILQGGFRAWTDKGYPVERRRR